MMRTNMKLVWAGLMGLAMAMATSGSATAAGSVGAERSHAVAASALNQTASPFASAEASYRNARRALNNSEFRDAARLFSQLRDGYPASDYVGDSYYFEAYALYRTGAMRAMEQALALLAFQENEYPGTSTSPDAPSLRMQIEGGLARRGDRNAGARVAQQAAAPCDSADQELRSMALNALLQMNAERALPILREVLQNRDDCSLELRRQAVFLVSQHMTDESVDILLDLAHRDPDPDSEVRGQAVFWLSQVDSEEAVDALESILTTSDDSDVQEKALFALSQHSSARSIGILRGFAARSDVEEDLRGNAIFWIGQSDGGGAYLRELYGSVDGEDLKEKIIFGVSQSAEEEDGEWLLDRALDPSEDIEIRKNALFWAGQTGMELSRLSGMYQSVSDREMKQQIIFVLSQSSDSDAVVDQLLEIAENEEDPELKRNVVFWLGQSDDPRVADFLLRLIRP